MGLWGTVGGLLGGMIGQPVAGSAIGGAFDQSDQKITGVPTPTGGRESGENYRAFQDAAFPNTTPVERLGGNSGGYVNDVGSVMKAKSDMIQQKRDLDNRTQLADLNARASVIAASSPYGAMARKAGLMDLYGGHGGSYDTPTNVSRDEVPSKIAQNEASAGLQKAETPGAAAKSKQSEVTSHWYDKVNQGLDWWTNKVAGAGSWAGQKSVDIENFIDDRLKVPRKYYARSS